MNRVVIAEDEALLVEMLTEVFEGEGFEVDAFATADAAWSHLSNRAEPPDLLFTDVRMPGRMDGLELVRATTLNWPEVPVVISSGHVHEPSDVHRRALFLAKPWALDDLIDLCRNLRQTSS